jgi:hypothetical protein
MSTAIHSLEGIKALKVRVNVTAREGHLGLHAAGRWLDEGVNEFTLESDELPAEWAAKQKDPKTAGGPVTDADSGAILPLYTLQTKLNQLYTLEGRRRLDNGRWSEPRFELPDHSGNQKKKATPTAPKLITLQIIDRQNTDGSWDSEKAAKTVVAQPQNQQRHEQRR